MSAMKITKIILTSLLFVGAAGCGDNVQPEPENKGVPALIRYDYKPKEITTLCADQMKLADSRIADLLKIPGNQKNFKNTIAGFETILSDLGEITTPSTFMNYVSLDKGLRTEAEECEAALGQYQVTVMSRRDIYDALVMAEKQTDPKGLDQAQKRLVEETMKAFRKNGLFLSDDKLKEVKELKQKLATLETQFSSNLNESTEFVEMTKDDLAGVPDSMVNRLEILHDGKYKVTTKSTDYVPFMENAKSSEARHRMASAYENRAAEKNTKLLQEAVELRHKIAKLLQFKTWADYKTEDRMAKDAKNVWEFLNSLKGKLAIKNKQDMAALLKLKKEMEPGSDHLDPWDGTYYSYQLKKKEYSVDDEVVREYFPSDHVVKKMFEIYSQLLGVKFVPIPDAKVWAPDVKLYEIRDSEDGHFIAHFYTDFVPRDGKYGHAAAFTLRSGRMVDGEYRTPISAIVANFNPPSNGKPSLLTHDEVETVFHEFGHIMHQTLTKAPYATLSGSSVAQDFVEAPSQMLDNWVWDPKILKELSGSYKNPDKKIPDELLKQLVKTHYFNQGYFYTRQLLFAIFDMTLHTADVTPDATELYKKLYHELTSLTPLSDTHFPACFGHLMGGYDAGYYGYLWSDVFAQDMFTVFEKDGLLSSKVGAKYRKIILEQGDVYPADKLIADFLGRKPNNHAFFKRLGIH